jgi:large subunit ribosomal protein L25
MAEKVVVKAEKREGRGKNDSRRLRAAGKIPISIYGAGAEAVAAVVELKDLAAILRSDSGQNTIFTIDMVGEGRDSPNKTSLPQSSTLIIKKPSQS